MTFFEQLKLRQCVLELTDNELIEKLNNDSLTFYLGIDPTADSLHVGHLFGLINCKRLQNQGHKPIIVVGGGTGMIGDPSGKSEERNLLTQSVIESNIKALSKQINKIIKAKVVNNYDWISNFDVITFLRDIGKYFNINQMLAKESVKSRLDSGISYTEFTYQVLQALDFYYLYKESNCVMQVGGSEQWGNITAGLELIRKMLGISAKAYGFIWPLIVKADGSKFGKTESGAIWLDKEKTNVYEFYQFWLNTSDLDALRYLYQFSFLDVNEIKDIEKLMQETPHLRHAQKVLGKEMTTLIHSKVDYMKALAISKALFEGDIKKLTAKDIEIGFKDVPTISINSILLVEALVSTQLATSKREARTFISQGAVQINGEKVEDLNMELSAAIAIENKFSVIRRGKKKYALIKHT